MAGWQFWIDRGGTFTDIVARDELGNIASRKYLSESPGQYEDAAVFGIRSFLGLSAEQEIPGGAIERIKMGTTIATNALLERKGARTLMVINKGFADLLRIGNQARPRLFDLDIKLPSMLYECVAEVAGRVSVDGTVIEALDEAAALSAFQAARAGGIEAVAIALMHAWRFPEFETKLGKLAALAGFTQVTLSHVASPLLRLVPRGDTSVADAYLSPVLKAYVARVQARLNGADLFFVQSHGGLAKADLVSGKDSILSGPAGGIVGAARTAAMAGFDKVISFDMGGTSTDVALYEGRYQHSFETEIAGVRLRVPMLSINTVAAGGGSILSFERGRLRAGPQSAGANPGPASYRKGGPLTVTDANILLNKILPQHFPSIFGADGTQSLDAEIVRNKFDDLAKQVSQETGEIITAEMLGTGFIKIAVANMANAIKQISIQKGYDPAAFTLTCFGGAGGQHACLVADELGMERIFIHPLAGVLSAFGIGLADFVAIKQQAVELVLEPEILKDLIEIKKTLEESACAMLRAQNLSDAIKRTASVHIRYEGTDTALPVLLGTDEAMQRDFEAAHKSLFGFTTPSKRLVVEMLVVQATIAGEAIEEAVLSDGPRPPPLECIKLFSNDAWHESPVYDRASLRAGNVIQGPALLRETLATTVIEDGWQAEITTKNHCILTRITPKDRVALTNFERADPVLLELFANLFMSIAEQAGAVLRSTAQSVNIKERLDFSCAIFDAQGGLVANAPHVPVHLGAMGASVRQVIARRGAKLRPGDAVALNNPFAGGTHLPDITLISPVFDEAGTELLFFVACRAHHADVGGMTPGSTPPFSKTLDDEGVVIDNLLLLVQGKFQETAFRHVLQSAKYPARNPEQNIGDIKAQIAANQTSITALQAVIARYGWPAVSAYMTHVMNNAEAAIRNVIDTLSDGQFDYEMDDGARLCVSVKIDHSARSAVIDFTGSSPSQQNNFNAPEAVITAAVLYSFRCLVKSDIPLNEGCLKPLKIIVPASSFLSPPKGSAVVAGNTEVSQAVTAALLGALGACASAQATMNNFLFGNDRYQYYETICGGTGAGPEFDGTSAVHTHMTNTRMTDPEIMELRYPVRVEVFSIRKGSGGRGAHPGGDGVVRKIKFLEDMTATIVASRRVVPPFGLAGGGPGALGEQYVLRANGTTETLTGRAQIAAEAGDVFVIKTPGGGGYGIS